MNSRLVDIGNAEVYLPHLEGGVISRESLHRLEVFDASLEELFVPRRINANIAEECAEEETKSRFEFRVLISSVGCLLYSNKHCHVHQSRFQVLRQKQTFRCSPS